MEIFYAPKSSFSGLAGIGSVNRLIALRLSQAGAQTGLLDRSWGDYAFGTSGGDREDSRMGREEIIAREGYCSTGGCVLRLEGAKCGLTKPGPGKAASSGHHLHHPYPGAVALPVAITRDISFQGKSLGRTKSLESRKLNGTWVQEMDFTLPATARSGLYTLKTKVSTGYGLSEKETQFQVQ